MTRMLVPSPKDDVERAEATELTSKSRFWKWFIVGQTVVIVAWIIGIEVLKLHYDNHGLTILNLGLSLQAAYTAPILAIVGVQGLIRSAVRDHRHRRQTRLDSEVLCRIAEKVGVDVSDLTTVAQVEADASTVVA